MQQNLIPDRGVHQTPADILNQIEIGNLPTLKQKFLPNHSVDIRSICRIKQKRYRKDGRYHKKY